MSNKNQKTANRQFTLSNINGLFLVAGVLTATILMAGVSEAKYQRLANNMAKVTEFKVKKEMKVAYCPLSQTAPTSVIQ